MTRDVAHRLIDLNSPNGLYEKMAYGPLYKVTRNVSAIMDYWLATGDEHAKRGFLKAVDYQYRFQRDGVPISYQNGAGMYYTMAYRFTERPAYLRLAKQSVASALIQEPASLSDDLAPGLDKLDRLPHRGVHLNLHPLFSTPIVLKLLSEADKPIEPFPLLDKNFDSAPAWAAFEKSKGDAVSITMYYNTLLADDAEPVVLGPSSQPVEGVTVAKDERISYYADPGIRYFYAKVEVPAHLAAGTYRIGLTSTGPFRILDANVDRMVLECPEGMWLGGGGLSAGMPFFFRVPPGKKDVRLFLGREVVPTRSDGSPAKDPTGKQIGDVALPVDGKTGLWKLEFTEPALIVFRNIEPVVSFGTKERFFRPSRPLRLKAAKPELPPKDAQFVRGVIGQAIQLNGRDLLRYARGEKLPDGSFDNFPGNEGTIELYFRPNWSSIDFPVMRRRLYHFNFVSAGSLSVYHRCGQGPVASRPYAYVDLLCKCLLGAPSTGRPEPLGNQARMYFRPGDWTHVAATWKIDLKQKKREDRAVFFVFINGKKRLRTWNYPRTLPTYRPFRIDDIAEWVTIGTCDGTFDELRVSDVVRYDGDFAPSKRPFAPDKHTKALFHFDGAPEGVGAGGERLNVEYRDRK